MEWKRLASYIARSRAGQSLVEIVIALSIGAILIGFSTGIIVLILRSNLESGRVQIAANIGNQLTDNVKVVAVQNWHNIYNLSKGSANHYYIDTTTTPFTATTTEEQVTVEGFVYTRYFYLENVSRDSSGFIVGSGGTDDPSTQRVTVSTSWENNEGIELVSYIARSRNETFLQSNWAGGSGEEGAITGPTSRFSSASNIDVTDSGALRIQEF
jgi:hypothetical protein